MSKLIKIPQSYSEVKNQKRWKFALITFIIIATSIVLFRYNPASSELYPPSPFRVLTGLYCPGCGTLRALHQLLHGQLITAFGLNPLMLISLPFLIGSYLNYGVEAIKGKSSWQIFIPAKLIWFILQLIIAYWVVRNIPFHPFTWLAP
jgi:lipoprotein signal peptidase